MPEAAQPPAEAARFARNTFWLGVAQVVRVLTSVLLLTTVPNFLPDVAGYGRLKFALSLCAIFAVLADFGLSEITVRDLPKDRSLAESYLHNILGMKIILALAVFGGVALTCVALDISGDARNVVLLIGGYTIMNSFSVTLNHQFRGMERMSCEAGAVALQNALVALCVLTALFISPHPVPVALGYLVAGVLSSCGTALIYRVRFGAVRPAFDRTACARLARKASYFLLSNVVLLVYLQIDVVMLGRMLPGRSGETQVGLYQASAGIVSAVAMPVVVILGAIVPQLSRLYAHEPDRFNNIVTRLTRIIVSLVAPLAVVACIFCNEIIAFIFKSDYAPAGEMLRLLAAALLIRHIVPYRTVLSVTGHQRTVFGVSLFAAVLNIVLNAFLIPLAGGWGAGAATVITCLAVTVTLAAFSLRKLKLQVIGLPIALIIVPAALLADGAREVLFCDFKLPLPCVIMLYGAAYAAVVYFAALSAKDRRHAMRSIRRLLRPAPAEANPPDETRDGEE